jgi:tetratricopeptide (TPR) repeat protein
MGAIEVTPESTILHIQELIQAGDLSGAEDALERALSSDAQNGGLYNLRGIIHANRSEMKQAEEDFARAVRLRPDLESAYLNLGRACEMLSSEDPGARDRAISQYRALLRRKPLSDPARVQLAKLLSEEGKFEQSLTVLDGLSLASRDGGLVLLLRGINLAATGQNHQAEQAIESFDRNHPLPPEDLTQLANGYERTGRYAEARTVMERRAALGPQNADVLLDLARLAQEQNDLKGALGYLAHARELKPDSAQVHFFFGVVCIEMNLPVEAKKSLDRALEQEGENPWYNYARGSVELQGKSAWQAIPYFQKAIAARPSDPRYRFALGAAEFASAEYESAKKDMNAIANRKETAGGAEYILGRIAKVDSEWAEAAEHFQKSIAAEPNYADSHAELGLALAHQNDFTAAKSEIDRALQIDPLSYPAHVSLLFFYQRTKNPLAAGQQQKLQELQTRRVETQELLVRTIKVLR